MNRVDKRLLAILCCPTSHQPVTPLTAAQIESINRAIAIGDVQQHDGARLAQPLQEGLITRDGQRIYRIDDGIPVMLPDEAIATDQLKAFPA